MKYLYPIGKILFSIHSDPYRDYAFWWQPAWSNRPATMFRNGFKSVGQILLLFAVVAAIYPKVGFCKRKAVVEGEFEDLKDGIKIIMEDRGYRLESENGEKMTFRLTSKINAVARMLEDRVTVCAVPDGLEVEGITKDVIRIISNLEYRLRSGNE